MRFLSVCFFSLREGNRFEYAGEVANSPCILISFGALGYPIFWGFGYPREKPLLGKNRFSPSDSPFPKISAFIDLFYPLIQVNASIKLIDKDKIHIKNLIQRTRKEKADIQKYK